MPVDLTHGADGELTGQVQRAEPERPFGLQVTPYDPVSGKRIAVGPPPAYAFASQFKVIVEDADILVCRYWDGFMYGDPVVVAKSYDNRRTPFDGDDALDSPVKVKVWDNDTLTETEVEVTYVYRTNYERVASIAGETDEVQVMSKPYRAGEIIVAIRVAGNRTRVGVQDPKDDTKRTAVEWVEIDSNKRWAKKTNG